MPEGDTIHKLAALLRPELDGARVHRLTVRGRPVSSLPAPQVRDVFARGKHLFIEFEDRVQLRSHLGMRGTWHRYRPGEPWRRPRRQAWIVLEFEDTVLVCFNAKEVELLRGASVRSRQLETHLGPDLTREAPPLEAVRARARAMLPSETSAADLLLDQRVACGIGNVYKSEVLFLEGIHPRRALGSLGDDDLARIYRCAGELLRRNLGPGPRTTRFSSDGLGILWVYRRKDLPCLRCEATIMAGRLGQTWRSTYWCPACQPETRSSG